MNDTLSRLSDVELLKKLEHLATCERKLVAEILDHLREVDRRKLFSDLGFRSLYDYCIKKLKFSSDQAYRRIQAMRLLKELPDLKEKVDIGEITLTNMAQAQKFFVAVQKDARSGCVNSTHQAVLDVRQKIHNKIVLSKVDKYEIVKSLSDKTTREAEVALTSLASDPSILRADFVREIKTQTHLTTLGDQMNLNKNQTEQYLLPDGQVLQSLNGEACKPAESSMMAGAGASTFANPTTHVEIRFTAPVLLNQKIQKLLGILAHKNPRASLAGLFNILCDLGLKKWDYGFKVRESVKKAIWSKSEGKCSRCGSTHALELDHIKPKALGGTDDISNLRLLCRNCNLRMAVRTFGVSHIEKQIDKGQLVPKPDRDGQTH